MALDPFFIFATLVEIVLVGYVVWLLVKVGQYLKYERIGATGDVKWWAKAILDANAPTRPTQEYIDALKKSEVDIRGKKVKYNRRLARYAAVGAVAAVVVLGQVAGLWNVFGIFEQRVEVETFIVYPVSVQYFSNLTSCPRTTSQWLMQIPGAFVVLWFDDEITNETFQTGKWYEIDVSVSQDCANTFVHLVDAREITVTRR